MPINQQSIQQSIDINQLILVDEDDNAIGCEQKIPCHLGHGRLHRAFSILLFDCQGQLLLQQRSAQKLLWPLYWSNTCCSHPAVGESVEDACKRRLVQELNLQADVHFIYKFQYYAKYLDIGAESELCYVMVGVCDQQPQAVQSEVAAIEYVSIEQLDDLIAREAYQFTPWFKQEWQALKLHYWPQVTAIIGG